MYLAPLINITCLLGFFSKETTRGDTWAFCEEEEWHCLCGRRSHEPLCAPPDVVEAVCSLDNPTVSIFENKFVKNKVSFFKK
jgi:hypothetical protein